jgi:hypothetical protein
MDGNARILYNPRSSKHLNWPGVRARVAAARSRAATWRHTLAGETRKSPLLIPVASFAFAILLQTVAGAYFIGRLAERVDTMRGDLQDMRGSMGQTVDQRVQSELLKKQVSQLETELRLLRDYTEGRISQLPYRRSITLTGEPGGQP